MRTIGFTGTGKRDLPIAQWMTLRNLLIQLNPAIGRHGDCVHADYQFHVLFVQQERPKLIIHPGHNNKGLFPSRAFAHQRYPAEKTKITVLEPRPYIHRDHDIVDSSHALIACPLTENEIIRSGTWTTYRYAKKTKKHIFLILPTGELRVENEEYSTL